MPMTNEPGARAMGATADDLGLAIGLLVLGARAAGLPDEIISQTLTEVAARFYAWHAGEPDPGSHH